jgi:hypothetical protein
MFASLVRRSLLLVALGLAWTVFAAAGWAEPQAGSGAGKDATNNTVAIRKALDQKITLDYSTQNFQEAIDHLRQKTKLNFVLDTYVLQMVGIGIGEIPTPVNLKIDNGKVRVALQNMLNQYHLTYVILGDSVLITTEEVGYLRQMRQRVNVEIKDQPLVEALKALANETGTNLVIDPRQADKAKSKISIQLDDVTLETAVRLLTELADLSSVRVGNVLFVTTEARADKLRKENPPNNSNQGGPYERFAVPPAAFPGGLPPIGGRVGPPGPGQPPPPLILPAPQPDLPQPAVKKELN